MKTEGKMQTAEYRLVNCIEWCYHFHHWDLTVNWLTWVLFKLNWVIPSLTGVIFSLTGAWFRLTLVLSLSLQLGCSRKKPHTPWLMGFWKFSWEGGSKTLEIQVGGGLNLRKSSAGVIWTDSSCDSLMFSSVTLQGSQTLKIVDIFCSHISHLT